MSLSLPGPSQAGLFKAGYQRYAIRSTSGQFLSLSMMHYPVLDYALPELLDLHLFIDS
jgi:hypothetical protein